MCTSQQFNKFCLCLSTSTLRLRSYVVLAVVSRVDFCALCIRAHRAFYGSCIRTYFAKSWRLRRAWACVPWPVARGSVDIRFVNACVARRPRFPTGYPLPDGNPRAFLRRDSGWFRLEPHGCPVGFLLRFPWGTRWDSLLVFWRVPDWSLMSSAMAPARRRVLFPIGHSSGSTIGSRLVSEGIPNGFACVVHC